MSKKVKRIPNMQRRIKTETAKAQSTSGGENTIRYVHGPRGVHAQEQDGDWHWMMQDGLGSVRGVAGDDLAVQEARTYGPYGDPLSVGTPQTMYGYTGEPTDDNGLVYLRERYYNPVLGTFLSQDPIEGSMNQPLSLNRYAYVQGNPVNLTDPSGMLPVSSQMINNMMHSNPLQFAAMMNAGMCFIQQPISACERLLQSGTSIRQLLEAGCIQLQPVPLQPGQEIMPITPTPNNFRLPVDNGSLSNCDFVSRTGSGLPSRDINPVGVPTPVPVYAPAWAEVMIVDMTGDNAGLGNFVAIRVHTSNVPAGLNKWGTGYIYLGYAHLSQVYVQSTAQAPFPQVSPAQPIGMTGAGGPQNQVHLDLTAFFVPESNTLLPEPRTIGIDEPLPNGAIAQEHEMFQAFYSLGLSPIFQPIIVDPLELWPELAFGTTCAIPNN